MSNGPMSVFLAISVIALFGVLALAAYSRWEFQATATETCTQIIDKNDFHTETIRNGNYVNERVVYHIYDTCKDRNGIVTKNVSVGYGSENEAILYGLMKR